MNFGICTATLIILSSGLLVLLLIKIRPVSRISTKLRKKEIEKLKLKEKELKIEFFKICVKKINNLNSMLHEKSISAEVYKKEKNLILSDMKAYEIDTSDFEDKIIPEEQNLKKLYQKKINIATILHEMGEISDKEFDKHINESLDLLNQK